MIHYYARPVRGRVGAFVDAEINRQGHRSPHWHVDGAQEWRVTQPHRGPTWYGTRYPGPVHTRKGPKKIIFPEPYFSYLCLHRKDITPPPTCPTLVAIVTEYGLRRYSAGGDITLLRSNSLGAPFGTISNISAKRGTGPQGWVGDTVSIADTGRLVSCRV